MNIQAKIKSRGFTSAQVAARMKKKSGGVGISQGTLSTILNGNPTIDKLREVADIIGMSVSELIQEDGEPCCRHIKCPYCDNTIRLSLTAEKEE